MIDIHWYLSYIIDWHLQLSNTCKNSEESVSKNKYWLTHYSPCHVIVLNRSGTRLMMIATVTIKRRC